MSASLSKNTADYRKRKMDRGLCTYGGCWEPTSGRSTWLCPYHASVHKTYNVPTPVPPRQCKFPECSSMVVRPAYLYCPDHNNARSQLKAARVRKLTGGICTRNGCREKSRKNLTTCARHGEAQRVADMKRRSKLSGQVYATAD